MPGAATSPWSRRASGGTDDAVRSRAALTPPTRRIERRAAGQSTIVDSTPTRHGPPSSTRSTSSPRSARTCVGGGRAHPSEPVRRRRRDRRRRTRRAARARADGRARAARRCRDRRSPRRRRGRRACGSTSVSGPGQNAVAERVRDVGNVARVVVERRCRRATCTITGWSAGRPFTAVEPAQRVGVRGVGAEPVHGLGRERDEPAAPQHDRRPASRRRRASASPVVDAGGALDDLVDRVGPRARRQVLPAAVGQQRDDRARRPSAPPSSPRRRPPRPTRCPRTRRTRRAGGACHSIDSRGPHDELPVEHRRDRRSAARTRRRGCAGPAPAHPTGGSTATTCTSGFCSFRYRPTPISVPLVPRPATNTSTSGQSRQISGPVRLVVRERVRGVAVLEQAARSSGSSARDLLGHADRAVAALLARRQRDLGAEDLEQLAALDRHVLGHHDAQRVAAQLRDQREPDAGVARRRLEDRGARLQRAVAPRRARPSCSAMRSFDEPPGFWPSSLAQMRTSGFGRQRVHADERRVADQPEDVVVACHATSRRRPPGGSRARRRRRPWCRARRGTGCRRRSCRRSRTCAARPRRRAGCRAARDTARRARVNTSPTVAPSRRRSPGRRLGPQHGGELDLDRHGAPFRFVNSKTNDNTEAVGNGIAGYNRDCVPGRRLPRSTCAIPSDRGRRLPARSRASSSRSLRRVRRLRRDRRADDHGGDDTEEERDRAPARRVSSGSRSTAT